MTKKDFENLKKDTICIHRGVEYYCTGVNYASNMVHLSFANSRFSNGCDIFVYFRNVKIKK